MRRFNETIISPGLLAALSIANQQFEYVTSAHEPGREPLRIDPHDPPPHIHKDFDSAAGQVETEARATKARGGTKQVRST